MERHGSETYYVIGEGLLGEARGGRDVVALPAPARTAAPLTAAPPFRFSRLGPKGSGKQLGRPNRLKIAQAMTHDNLSPGQIPAGYTYLGQFIDHDLTFDKSSLMEGVDISPATLLQSRSPSLDLDSLYGNGPGDPGSAKFYAADGIHLKDGRGAGWPARLRPSAQGERRGDHPRPAERREPRGRADPLRVHQVPQPRGRFARRDSRVRALPCCAPPRHEALPVDDPARLPRADLQSRDRDERLHAGTQGVRGRRFADQRPDDADRVLGCRVPARAQHGAGELQLEQGLPGRDALAAVRVHAPERRPAQARSRTSGSRTFAGSSTSLSSRR